MPKNSPDIESIIKFKEYRDKGLTYDEITKLMGKQRRTLNRWTNYLKSGKVKIDNKGK